MEIITPKFFEVKNPSPFEKLGKTRACRYCGQYPKKDQKFGVVVTSIEGTDLWKIMGNFFIHETCWEKLTDGCQTFEEVIHKIAAKRQPKATNQTKVDEEKVAVVKKALLNLNFLPSKETKHRLYFQKRGTRRKVAPFYYEKRFQTFAFTGRVTGWLDSLILKSVFDQIEQEVTRIESQNMEGTDL